MSIPIRIVYCTCVNTCLMLQYYCTQKVDTEDVNRSGLLSPSASMMSACFATPVSTARVLMPAWLPNTMSVCKLHTNTRGPSSGQVLVHKRTSTHTLTTSNCLLFTYVSPTKSARLGSKLVLHGNMFKEQNYHT